MASVYDTATGRYLLIPQGSRLVGKYDSNVAYGQDGVQVAWNRIIFPRCLLDRSQRVLTTDEECRYLKATAVVGDGILAAHARALEGIRAHLRGEIPTEPNDPFLLRDVTTILLDCGLRPEESFRLRWQHVQNDVLHIPFGKTENARRRIPLTQRAGALLSMRRGAHSEESVFPASTRTGHVEKSSLRRQHRKAIALAKVKPFNLYTLRHTCLTRWAAHMDPYTLAYLAGHSDFSTTKRYVHPQADTVRSAMERAHEARGSHSLNHSWEKGPLNEKVRMNREVLI